MISRISWVAVTALCCAGPAVADEAALHRTYVAADLATAAWAELGCVDRSMDVDVVAALAERHGISARDLQPGGDLFHTVDGQLLSLDLAGIEKGRAHVCDRLLDRYQGGLADGALIDHAGPPPDVAELPPVVQGFVIAAAMRRQATARDIVAEAAVAEAACGASLNHVTLSAILQDALVDGTDPAEIARMQAVAERHQAQITASGVAAWCKRAAQRFGPAGVVVAGVIQ